MAISDEIQRLQNAKAALKTAIENKGVAVPADALIDDYAALVDAILYDGLPAAYTELEYIQSSGTQYIDTGIVPANKKLGAIIDFQFTDTSNAVAGVFGSCVSNNTDNLQLTIYSSKWRYKINNWGEYGNVYDSNRHIVSLNMPNGTKLDNVVVNSTQYTIASSNTRSCFLAGYSHNGTIQPVPSERYSFIGKIFSAKVYDNTQLVMNLIPAKRNSDNAIGMYDKVSGTFFTNAGTGTFSYGELA